MAITAFSNLALVVSEGGTVPSIDSLQTKSFVDIGSGNVLKLSWDTPMADNNKVASYKISILLYNTAAASYQPFYVADVGNVNEFYITSDLLKSITAAFFQLAVYIEAVSSFGTIYGCVSNTEYIAISRGCGMYADISESFSTPVTKRTIAFAQLGHKKLTDIGERVLADIDGKVLYLQEVPGQDPDTGWAIMQEFYSKDPAGNWHTSDIKYEVLTDNDGNPIVDSDDSPIYLL